MPYINGLLSSKWTLKDIYQAIENASNKCLTDAELLRCKLVSCLFKNFCLLRRSY